MSLTSVDAIGVNTVKWLTEEVASVAVPVYQRHYRWDIDSCYKLLQDIRQVADSGDGSSHFIGSILATAVTGAGSRAELTLIDGQQRVTTLTLLAVALQQTLNETAPALAGQLRAMLTDPSRDGAPKLVPHPSRSRELSAIISGARPEIETGTSSFEENYQFFLREVRNDADRVLRGLRRLEHVYIRLTEQANPQQVFESLNSTGP
jgi:Protein of unknown function DUF262